ncbi:4'-phosphopantetheinyl transferase superfamily protein [Flavobacteriaceae bacterium R38]|nr:4'-phosphopantetheinyl transferase superfamily protein [Flavobacteriaceae bacterium R38]
MIGNDIIDLKQAARESNWRRRGYLDKIYTDEEQQEIYSSINPEKHLWILWSIKEAAYKIVNRHTGKRFYNPKKLISKLIHTDGNVVEGQVFYEESCFLTHSEITDSYVHTVAVEKDTCHLNCTISSIDLISSSSTNDLIKRVFKSSEFQIYKDENLIPFLSKENSNAKIPVSVSHHGEYISLAVPGLV